MTIFVYNSFFVCALRGARPIDPVLPPPSSWRTLAHRGDKLRWPNGGERRACLTREQQLVKCRAAGGRSIGASHRAFTASSTCAARGIERRESIPLATFPRAMSAALGAPPARSSTRVSASPRVVRARRADRRRGPPSRSAVGATTPRDPPSRAPRPSPSPAARFHIPVSRLTRSSLASHPLLTSPARLVSPRSRPEGLPRLRARHR